MPGEDDELDITIGDADAPPADAQAADDEADGGDDGETVIAFADEAEDGEDDLADVDEKAQRLIRDLRGKLRESNGQLSKYRRTPPPAANEGDPEPQVPDEPGPLEVFDYDEDKQREAWRAHREGSKLHEEWRTRQHDRETERNRAAERQAKQVEQQRNSLGVADYEARAALVHDSLSEQQLAVLVNGAANPAKLIYALGRSPTKLDQLAGEDNLARFAVMVGGMERDVKVSKRNAPAADTRVRGATASATLPRADKELERLEKEAERTNDRSKIAAYRRKLREQKAA